nr:immunoglobulin light chain junction region [Macaca mulatta]
CIQSLEFPYSF